MPPGSSALPAKGDVIAGKYQVEGLLGQGGMGAVFEVSHRVTGKRFALKWLLPNLTAESDAVKRFIREAQVAGRVDHPNIVEVYDVGQEGESFFMVMELLQGEPLSARLTRAGKLTPAQACEVMVQVCDGLSAAHAAGVIHRDLKPDNIFLCRGIKGGEAPKLLDFGISKMGALAGEVSTSMTRAGTVMGTPHYMSPEQVRARPVDVRTDVYALGVILYQLLSGELPFPGDTYSDLVLRIMTEAPVPLAQLAPGTPSALINIIQKAMSREPEARYANAAELQKALTPFASGAVPALDLKPSPLATPSNPRLATPLSTESHRLATGDFPRAKTGLLLGLSIAVVATLGIGYALVRLANQPSKESASKPLSAEPSKAAASAAPRAEAPAAAAPSAPPANAAAPGELPTPRTERVAPDPSAAPRAWQPPPGSAEAPRPLQGADGMEPPTRPPANEPRALDLGPEGASAKGNAKAQHHHERAHAGAERKRDEPPAPSLRDDAPTRSQPARASQRTPGLSVEDF